MEEKYHKRVRRRLAKFEKNSKEWEWSDLIKWLQSLQQVVDTYKEFTLDEELTTTLATRLAQCLNPGLPEGLHSKTLEIYKILLSTVQDQYFHLFSAGLFSFFQYCTNKDQFLELIDSGFVNRITKNKHILSGLICCLISGAEEKQELFQKVVEIIDKCADQMRIETHGTILWLLLKHKKHRFSALMYLGKRMDISIHKNFAITAILEALTDSNMKVKRHTLDLIKSYFPLSSPYIPFEHKVLLMEGALILVESKDHTLIRRLWEWTFPNELDENQIMICMNVLKPALENVFRQHHNLIKTGDNEDIKLKSIRIVDVLIEDENIGDLILENIAMIYVGHIVEDEIWKINDSFNDRVLLIFKDERTDIFWKAFEKLLTEHLEDNADFCFKILEFGTKYFDCPSDCTFKIVTSILCLLPIIENKARAIKLCDILNSTLDSVPFVGGNKAIELYIQLSNQPYLDKEFLLLLGNYICKLSLIGLLCTDVINQSKFFIEENTEMLLVSLEILINMKYPCIPHKYIHHLWWLLSTPLQETALKLLIKSHAHLKSVWNEALALLLLDGSICVREKAIWMFITFWEKAALNWSDELQTVLLEGTGVFIMIDFLTDESPIIRHTAKEWIVRAQCKISCLLDPIFAIIFQISTKRTQISLNSYKYNRLFDAKRVINALKKIISLIKYGDKNFIDAISISEITADAQEFISPHDIKPGTYLEVLISGMLVFITSESDKMLIENKAVQEVACEILELLGRGIKSELAFKILEVSLVCMHSSILTKNTATENQLLIVIQTALFESGIESTPNLCTETLLSPVFKSSILKRLHTENQYLRLLWMKFITRLVSFMICYLPHQALTEYLESLLHSYVSIIVDTSCIIMFTGLRALIHQVLEIDESVILKARSPDQIKNMVFKEFGCLFSLANSFLVLNENGQNSPSIFIQFCGEFRLLLSPISLKYPNELMSSIFSFWIYHSKLPNKSYVHLPTFAKLLPHLHLKLDKFLEIILDSLESMSNSKNRKPQFYDGKELNVAHFVYACLEVCSTSASDYSEENIWAHSLSIVKLLMSSAYKEMLAYIIYILNSLIKFTKTFKITSDRKLMKDLQETVENVFEAIEDAAKWDKEPSRLYYPNHSDEIEATVGSLVLNSFCNVGLNVILMAWPNQFREQRESGIISKTSKRLISSIEKESNSIDAASSLLSILVESGNERVIKSVSKSIVEFITSSNFYEMCYCFPKAMKPWTKIISMACTHKNSNSVSNLLKTTFGKPQNDYSASVRNLLTAALLIYSGEKNDFAQFTQSLNEMIIEYIKSDRLLPACCLLIRVISIRFDDSLFKDIWTQIWPHLHITLISTIPQRNLLFPIFSILRLVDMFLATKLLQFQEIMWLYLFDVPEIELIEGFSNDFMPLLVKPFIGGFRAVAKRVRRTEDTAGVGIVLKRRMQLPAQGAENYEDLERMMKNLIQYCMLYNSEMSEADWDSINEGIEADFISVNSKLL